MTVKGTLWALVVATMVLAAVVGALMPEPLLAILSAGVGLVWLALEVRAERDFGTVFFLFFLVVAVLGSLKNIPAPLILLAVSTNLAAWDLSAFRARIAGQKAGDARDALERNHLRKLGITAVVGFAAALIPTMTQISLSFAALLAVLLAAVIVLRGSVGWLRGRE